MQPVKDLTLAHRHHGSRRAQCDSDGGERGEKNSMYSIRHMLKETKSFLLDNRFYRHIDDHGCDFGYFKVLSKVWDGPNGHFDCEQSWIALLKTDYRCGKYGANSLVYDVNNHRSHWHVNKE